jgi:hypothetical protein
MPFRVGVSLRQDEALSSDGMDGHRAVQVQGGDVIQSMGGSPPGQLGLACVADRFGWSCVPCPPETESALSFSFPVLDFSFLFLFYKRTDIEQSITARPEEDNDRWVQQSRAGHSRRIGSAGLGANTNQLDDGEHHSTRRPEQKQWRWSGSTAPQPTALLMLCSLLAYHYHHHHRFAWIRFKNHRILEKKKIVIIVIVQETEQTPGRSAKDDPDLTRLGFTNQSNNHHNPWRSLRPGFSTDMPRKRFGWLVHNIYAYIR